MAEPPPGPIADHRGGGLGPLRPPVQDGHDLPAKGPGRETPRDRRARGRARGRPGPRPARGRRGRVRPGARRNARGRGPGHASRAPAGCAARDPGGPRSERRARPSTHGAGRGERRRRRPFLEATGQLVSGRGPSPDEGQPLEAREDRQGSLGPARQQIAARRFEAGLGLRPIDRAEGDGARVRRQGPRPGAGGSRRGRSTRAPATSARRARRPAGPRPRPSCGPPCGAAP